MQSFRKQENPYTLLYIGRIGSCELNEKNGEKHTMCIKKNEKTTFLHTKRVLMINNGSLMIIDV